MPSSVYNSVSSTRSVALKGPAVDSGVYRFTDLSLR